MLFYHALTRPLLRDYLHRLMARTAYIIEKDCEHLKYFFYDEPLDKAAFKGLAEYAEREHGEDVVVRRASDSELAAIDNNLMRLFSSDDSDD